ncbi:MAG: STT3 domain-containing protein, partial [Candidatus Aenigmatarchaeota archaeon]
VAGLIAFLGFWLRYRPAAGMRYLQALDPYMIYRMSQHLALSGNLPQLDFMRYFPYAAPTYTLNQGDILIPAVLYNLGPSAFMSYMSWAKLYPALMGGFGVYGAFLFAREIWDEYAGLFSAFFLAVIAGAMHRTSAGFFEKEPVGTALMMFAMYFFVRSWRREESLAGMASGLMLGLFTISWGGSKMLWLLLPLTIGFVALLDRDIRQLVTAYTPTVVIGAGIGASLNPSRFWFTSDIFVANLGILALLWTRYLVEELELVKEEKLGYVIPGLSATGGVLVLLSPLYSDFIAGKLFGLIGKINQGSSGDVIAGTVAENSPASLGQLVSQLGALSASRVSSILGLLSRIAGTWPLTFIGIAMLATKALMMCARRFDILEEKIERLGYYKLLSSVFLLWIISFSLFFQSSIVMAAVPAVLVFAAAMIAALMKGDLNEKIDVRQNWYELLALFWVASNVLAAVTKSRLVFLATFSVAVTAGYTASRAFKALEEFDYSEIDPENTLELKAAVVGAFLVVIVAVNAASGFAASGGIGGSPNQAWHDNLDWMESNTSEGSVIMSWWDYGYWFESIGRRAAVADGGNQRYYTKKGFGKVNYPLADFLTSTNPSNNTEILRRHSVDYIVLDSTMIGKYTAVSQIAHRSNGEFNAMRTVRSRNLRQGIGNGTATFRGTNIRRTKLYASFEAGRSGLRLEEAPVAESPFGRGKIDCVLTQNGRKRFNVSRVAKFPELYFHRPAERRDTTEVCIAEHPYYSYERGAQGGGARMVLVPKSIANSTLVRLYLMNGKGLEFAEPVPEGSNGFVRTWKVTGPVQ